MFALGRGLTPAVEVDVGVIPAVAALGKGVATKVEDDAGTPARVTMGLGAGVGL